MNLKVNLIVSIVIAISFILGGIISQQISKPIKYAEGFRESIPTEISAKNLSISKTKLYETRFSFYKEELKSLNKIQLNIIILIAVSLLVLLFKQKTLTVPIISVPIPDGLIYLLLFFGGIYAWVILDLNLTRL